jgi:hypothetical protein
MGAGYYQPVTTWAKGQYQDANNLEDELAMITSQNNNVAYRPDDTGATLATSRYLEIYSDFAASAEGVIERTDDTDAFQFTTTGGQVSLTARPVGDWASLAVSVTLADSTDTIINSNNPQNVLYATISTNLPAGTYTFRVTGVGRNSPLTNGFSSYSSLGYYSIAGSIAGGTLPTRLTVMEKVANGTTVGTVPATNPADTLAYSIISGNSNNTFSVDNNGLVTVANNTLLDYARMSTNSMLGVQFELLVSITDISNPTLTELSRRVVIGILSTNLNYPITVTGFNAGVIAPYNATPALPKATGFDILNNYAFYQAGLNNNLLVGGTGGGQGLPSSGTFLSQADGTTFQLGAYGATNALLVGRIYPQVNTLTLAAPRSYNSIAILAASANGGSGTGNVVLNFTNGTKSVFNLNAQDWFNNTTNVAIQGIGRLKLGQATLQTEDPGFTNPNLYQTTINLAALGLNVPVASITFTNPNTSVNQNSGVFAVSGSLMPSPVIIAQQPQSVTNNNPAVPVTLSVGAMGAGPLGFQWYSGSPAASTLLGGKTSSNLSFNPVSTNDQGSYFVVVSNSINTVTSSVATLTVYGAPVITRQLSPTNLVLFTSQFARFFVSANAATPLNYYWWKNGNLIPGILTSNYTIGNLQLSNSANYSVTLSNAFGSVTSSIVTLTVVPAPASPYGQVVAAANAKGYWRLDETTGTVAHDYVGGNNGVFTNVALNQTGNNLVDTHKAARFGSLASANSYVANVPIDFATTTNAMFSVEAWVNGGAQTSDAGLITRGSGGGGEQLNLDCGGTSHAFRFFVRDMTGAAHLASGTLVPNSQWHHLVGVCDEINGLVVLYVDGVSNASGTIPAGSGLLASTNALTFGSRQSGAATPYNSQFVGNMEEVAIYNYALSPAQVQAHYGAATNRPPVFLANPFTEPSINAATSYSSVSANISTNATDPNADAITFAVVSGPSWLTVAANGALSGTPLNANAGTNTFVVSARDPASASNTATLLIYVNGAPTFTANPFSAASGLVGQAYSASIAAAATDPNSGDTLSFSRISGPAWLSVAANGNLSGTPGAGDYGTNSFVVRVTDSGGLFDTATMNLTISRIPILTSISLTASNAVLNWTGGQAPYQVEAATVLVNPDWQPIATSLNTNSYYLSPTNSALFFRVKGQ